MNRNTSRGFTLVELLVTVAIVGILAAIAYPSYAAYLVRSNRSAAQAHLMDVAQAETQYMADTRTYASTLTDLKITTPAKVGALYDISIEVAEVGSPPAFTITATPKTGSTQESDGELSINSAGERTPGDKW